MADVSASPAVPFAPSFVEDLTVTVVTAVTTGDCAVVRGALAGWELREHAASQRDARVALLVAHYKAR